MEHIPHAERSVGVGWRTYPVSTIHKYQSSLRFTQVNNMFTCPNCQQSFEEKRSLWLHFRAKHCNEKIQCDICPATFVRILPYLTHKESVHSGKDEVLQCNLCQKSFPRLGLLNAHINRVHQYNKKLSCEFCEKSFPNKWLLISHVKEVHGDLEEAQCNLCDKKFYSTRPLKALQKHIETNHSNKTHQCSSCLGVFTSKSSLKRHFESVHTDTQTFECESIKNTKVDFCLLPSTSFPCCLASQCFLAFIVNFLATFARQMHREYIQKDGNGENQPIPA